MNLRVNTPSTARSGSDVTKTDGTAGAKSDTLALARPAVGILASVNGTAAVVTHEGHTVVLPLVAGVTVPLVIAQVRSTSTSLADSEMVLFFTR